MRILRLDSLMCFCPFLSSKFYTNNPLSIRFLLICHFHGMVYVICINSYLSFLSKKKQIHHFFWFLPCPCLRGVVHPPRPFAARVPFPRPSLGGTPFLAIYLVPICHFLFRNRNILFCLGFIVVFTIVAY